MPNKSKLILSGYLLVIIAFLYFGLNGIIYSTSEEAFPNVKFVATLFLLFVVAWSIGLGVRKFIQITMRDNERQAKKTKELFLKATVVSWIVVLILFWKD
ncbi:hypothetical protein AEA09_12720 [Lysinibacillus contaminans]|uniref:Uncharacterized protein n=1 Tax=Lysinibacillus contaminans TaxID=1293441 RepID=A0ABR5K3J0_9BACI|nr:hypothetical protein [Lysinibacillus contaminans]KOS69339.1 hypothetical protein AEA09_12720 [Lysinibacillus contaminans]